MVKAVKGEALGSGSATLAHATDVAGEIVISAADGAESGRATKVSFGFSYSVAPMVMICAANAEATAIGAYVKNTDVHGFEIWFAGTTKPGVSYVYHYSVVETQ